MIPYMSSYFVKVGKSIQEWTKYNLCKTVLKKLKEYGLLKQTISLQIF